MLESNRETPVEHSPQGDSHAEESNGGSPRLPRKYVLFADGTGNAFTTQRI